MSLNKLRSFEKYSIIKGELKANKLGLINATDNKCCFISNTGDKEIISRDITPADLPASVSGYGNIKTVYQQLDQRVNVVNTASAVSPIYNDTNSHGSRNGIDCSDFLEGDYLQINSYGFYQTPQAGAKALQGIKVTLTDSDGFQQDFSVYYPPSTNIRDRIVFPEAVITTSVTFWELDIKLIKNFINNEPCVKLYLKFLAHNSFSGDGPYSTVITRLPTTGIAWNSSMSVSWDWKYSSNAADLSPSFVIYTEESSVKKCSRIDDV